MARCSIRNLLKTVGSPKKSDVVSYITCKNKQALNGIYVSIASLGSDVTGRVKVYIWVTYKFGEPYAVIWGAGLAKDVHLNAILSGASPTKDHQTRPPNKQEVPCKSWC
jgi:hypothetical protein